MFRKEQKASHLLNTGSIHAFERFSRFLSLPFFLRPVLVNCFLSDSFVHFCGLQRKRQFAVRAASFFSASSESASSVPRAAAASIICSLASASASIIFASSLIPAIVLMSSSICRLNPSVFRLFEIAQSYFYGAVRAVIHVLRSVRCG